MPSIADIVSLTLLATVPLALLAWAWTREPRFLWVVAAIVIASFGVGIFQRWIPHKRPIGAANCDAFNAGGSFEDKYGFPSGHVSITAAFCFTMMLVIGAPWAYAVAVAWVLAMMWSRVARGCHTVSQVVGGCLFGAVIAAALRPLLTKVPKN